MRNWIILLGILLAGCRPQSDAGGGAAFDRVSDDPVVHGERLAKVLGCTGCHGDDLSGRDWSDELGTLWTSNLTRSAAGMSDADFAKLLVGGRRDGGRELWDMPSYLFTRLGAGETEAIIAFVRSKPVTGEVHPLPSFGPRLTAKINEGAYRSSASEVVRFGPLDSPSAGPQHAMARHIARATCAECHGVDLKGKQDPFGKGATPDIRTIAASYSGEDFDRLLTKGVAAGGREVGLMSEVARGRYAHLTPGERQAIFSYLNALGVQPLR